MRTIILASTLLLAISLQLLFSCQSTYSVETMQYVANGQKLYMQHCQNCHGNKGEGLGELYPPLTDHRYLSSNRQQLACIVRNGSHDEMVINGIMYNQQMPANPNLTEVDIAYILTYVTVQFGNDSTTYNRDEVRNALNNCQ